MFYYDYIIQQMNKIDCSISELKSMIYKKMDYIKSAIEAEQKE